MGTLSFDGKKFYFSYGASMHGHDGNDGKEAIRAGFIFSPTGPSWLTRSPIKAAKLRQYADKACEAKFRHTFFTNLPLPESIPYPDHLTPHIFQLESAWHCLSRSPAYVADEAGLGKTITAILCVNACPGRTLIICPPYLKYNWEAEFKKWSTHYPGISIATIDHGDCAQSLFYCDVVILPDSLLDNARIRGIMAFADEGFKWCFVDEAHRFKNLGAVRTQYLLGGDERGKWNGGFSYTGIAERTVLLSGTPIPNGRPLELWPVLSCIAPESIRHRSMQDFGKEFCGGKQVVRFEGRKAVHNWEYKGATNLGRFRRELKEKFMVRHLKKTCLPELPPKTRQIVFLDAPKDVVKFEKQNLANITTKEILEGVKDSAIKGVLAIYRRQCGEAKVTDAISIIQDFLDNHPKEKLVVFAHHITVVHNIHVALKKYGALKIRGGMDSKAKDAVVKLFQTVPEHRVVVANMEAAGVGNTMTAASNGIVVEAAWTPGTNSQAEDRLHRIGQHNNVYWKYLVLRNSLDERILRSVLEKEAHIDQAV